MNGLSLMLLLCELFSFFNVYIIVHLILKITSHSIGQCTLINYYKLSYHEGSLRFSRLDLIATCVALRENITYIRN
jgi:hypothetical protein